MTKEEIDILWHKAMRLSIEDGDQFTRYRFAALVESAVRKSMQQGVEPAPKRVVLPRREKPDRKPARRPPED